MSFLACIALKVNSVNDCVTEVSSIRMIVPDVGGLSHISHCIFLSAVALTMTAPQEEGG